MTVGVDADSEPAVGNLVRCTYVSNAHLVGKEGFKNKHALSKNETEALR
jgi:hypothetical protein